MSSTANTQDRTPEELRAFQDEVTAALAAAPRPPAVNWELLTERLPSGRDSSVFRVGPHA